MIDAVVLETKWSGLHWRCIPGHDDDLEVKKME